MTQKEPPGEWLGEPHGNRHTPGWPALTSAQQLGARRVRPRTRAARTAPTASTTTATGTSTETTATALRTTSRGPSSVPIVAPVRVNRASPATRAMPKSITLVTPSAWSITLLGLRSRWMTSNSWAYPTADSTCWNNGNVFLSGPLRALAIGRQEPSHGSV